MKVMNTTSMIVSPSFILLQPHVDESTASEEIITIKDIRPVLPESKEDIKKCIHNKRESFLLDHTATLDRGGLR